MNYTCIELKGCVYQPQSTIELNNFWIIPVGPLGSAVASEYKLILANVNNNSSNLIYFVLFYQFLFPLSSIYHLYSTQQQNQFDINCANIIDLEKEVQTIYNTSGGIPFDSNKIKNGLPVEINFSEFYDIFVKQYETNSGFKDVVNLFIYTIGFNHKLYDNILQKIAQLQTIFETIIEKPEQKTCSCCNLQRNAEDWDSYIKRKLKEFNIEEDIDLIVEIKKTLNKIRVRYIHNSSHINHREIPFTTLPENSNFYTTDFTTILKKKPENWNSVDWDNIFHRYSRIVRNLIFYKFLAKTNTMN